MNFSTMTLHSEESFFFYLNKFYYVISYLETETTKQWPATSWYESISCISLIRVRLTQSALQTLINCVDGVSSGAYTRIEYQRQPEKTLCFIESHSPVPNQWSTRSFSSYPEHVLLCHNHILRHQPEPLFSDQEISMKTRSGYNHNKKMADEFLYFYLLLIINTHKKLTGNSRKDRKVRNGFLMGFSNNHFFLFHIIEK